jgi:hypothetical protein
MPRVFEIYREIDFEMSALIKEQWFVALGS